MPRRRRFTDSHAGGGALLPRYDAADPAVADDPYPTYARLRDAGALCRGGPGQWVVTRHAEAAAALRDPRLGHQFPEALHQFALGQGPASSFFQRILLYRDPPEHTRLRHVLGAAFSPALMRQLARQISELVDTLLLPILERGRMDAIADLAIPLPVLIMCELLGVPASDRHEVRPRASDLGRAFGTQVPDVDRAAADRAVLWLREYIGHLVDERSRHPGEDLLTHMVASEAGATRLSREEIVDNAVFLFFAGFETTTHLIGNGCAALLRHPDQLARLRADRSLMPTAVEELLRFDAPIQGVARIVLQPIEIGGRTIREGRVLVLLLGSANHDERQFVDPAQLDVSRRPNPHLSFGGGIHGCLGAALARIEAAMAFGRLLDLFVTWEPDGPPVRQQDTRIRSYSSVPMLVLPT